MTTRSEGRTQFGETCEEVSQEDSARIEDQEEENLLQLSEGMNKGMFECGLREFRGRRSEGARRRGAAGGGEVRKKMREK
eukprot:747284-Hanusia_phi.AAC.4